MVVCGAGPVPVIYATGRRLATDRSRVRAFVQLRILGFGSGIVKFSALLECGAASDISTPAEETTSIVQCMVFGRWNFQRSESLMQRQHHVWSSPAVANHSDLTDH